MDGSDTATVIKRSASAVYEYITDMQYATDPPMGVSVTEVSRFEVKDGYAILHLDGPVPDVCGMMLMVGTAVLNEDDAGFDRYDDITRTVVVRPGREVLSLMSLDGCRVRILTDMRFIISSIGDFYERYGGLLELPRLIGIPSDPSFPTETEPSEGQRRAVETVLRNPMSYVWGAPGTGKTQFVLATCIRSCLRAGKRVAVFAPTNNSVEQVLRGILSAFGDEDGLEQRIIRLGVPTRDFFDRHPLMCEDRQVQRRMASCERELDLLHEVMYERSCDVCEWDVEELKRRAYRRPTDSEGRVMLADNKDLAESLRELLPLLSLRPETRDAAMSAFNRDFRDVVTEIQHLLFDRERPAAEIEEYSCWTDEDLIGTMFELEAEAEELRTRTTVDRLHRAQIVAATPFQFISRFRPRGSPEDGRMELDVDWIFLDEAGYCGLVQAAALFTNGVPVTMLGDHMQLPPVSQLDADMLRSAVERGGRMRDAYLWDMSALHCESLLRDGPGSLSGTFLESGEPSFRQTARADLTESHRFGPNLASVLDRYVYRNGMTGVSANGNLEISCVDTVCTSREGRENVSEAEAIRAMLCTESPDPQSIAILSPYTAQTSLLKRRISRRYRDCVMTVHGSQGREWDTVVLSVADNGVLSREVPFRFSSSSTEVGRRLINTAVSRAKRRLVIVCDRSFWLEKDGELIGGILGEVPPEGVEVFNRPGPAP